MTWVGIYFVILYVFGIAANFYYAGQGRVVHTRGVLIFAALWSIFNLFLMVTIGTGSI